MQEEWASFGEPNWVLQSRQVTGLKHLL